MTVNRIALQDLTVGPVLRAVNRCVEICLERQDGCARAAEEVSETGLKRLLADSAEERGLQAQAFLTIAEPLGTRFQSGIRARQFAPNLRSHRNVLDHCIARDEASRVELQVVFGWAPLIAMPMEVRAIMLSTYCATLRMLSELRLRLAGR